MILAGGSGTRLWPLARLGRPKQFLDLFGKKSLFRLTYERIVPLVGSANVLVVAGRSHVAWVRRQAPEIPVANIIAEAIPRNTATSIGLAAHWVRSQCADAMMVVLPADHWVTPARAFRSTIRDAFEALAHRDGLLTIGVPPTAPETGYGYIREAGRRRGPKPMRVAAFVEKPATDQAVRMVRSGRFLWNSGIFVWRAATVIDELGRWCPGVAIPLATWISRRRRGWQVPASVLRRIEALPIDRAVLERSKRVLVVRAAFRWSDVGTWTTLGEALRRIPGGRASLGSFISLRGKGCLGVNPAGLTVFVGVKDLIVVRSGTAVLVCARQADQQVRGVQRRLRGALHRFV